METDKKGEILEAAVALALEQGLHKVTRDAVAERARVSGALVNRYWGTLGALMDRVVAEGIAREHLAIVAQAILDKHPRAGSVPRRLQERAASHLIH